MDGYQSGFGNEFATEALEGALPVGRNSPQRCPYGLYAEQLSGTAFTAPRADNRRSWLYRIRPSAMHQPFEPLGAGRIVSDFDEVPTPPNQLRWNPLPMPTTPTDFVDGLRDDGRQRRRRRRRPAPRSTSTPPTARCSGRAFYNADGEMLIVPQQGRHRFVTELGVHRRRAAGDRRDPARRALSPRAARRQRRAATSARTTARRSACPTSARSARTAWPTRATS